MILLQPWLLLSLASVIAPLSITATGQAAAPKIDESQVADAIKRVGNNDLGDGPVDALSFVDLIAAARAVQGLPILEHGSRLESGHAGFARQSRPACENW